MRLAALFVTLTALSFLPGCTSEAASPAGEYTVTMDVTGKTPEEAKALAAVPPGECSLKADRTFTGTMEMAGKKSTFKGTWMLEGDKITMTATEQDGVKKEKPETATGTYMDGTIHLEMKEAGAPAPTKMILKRKTK